MRESPLNREDDMAYMSCLGPDATCTWVNDLDRAEGGKFMQAT